MTTKFKIYSTLLICLLWTTGAFTVCGQLTGDELKDISKDIFISQINIKSAPGATTFVGDVYLSGGVIVEVGPNLTPRPEARQIEGDSLYLYSAFINALSQQGLPEEPDDVRRSAWRGAPGATPLAQSGITPQVHIRDKFELTKGNMKSMHKQGIGMVHVVPKGFVMAGKGSVFSVREKDSYSSPLLLNETGMYAQFRNMMRVYPATPLATMSIWRQLITDVRNQKEYSEHWLSKPAGLERPQLSEEYLALFPVVEKEQPVFFNTSENKEILRALQLSRELDFDIVLSNVSGISPEILSQLPKGIQILVNLDLPEHPHREKDSKKEKDEEDDPEEEEDKDEELVEETETEEAEDKKEEEEEIPPGMTEEEFKSLKESRINTYNERIKLSAALYQKEMLAGFSFLDVDTKKTLSNVRELLDHGMSEDDLLAVLTTLPAKMLGIDGFTSTVEEGKQAQLVIFSKPFTEKEAEVRYIILDSELYKYKSGK
nr:amidohydrolase family protein [Saprospiraceae bacterium]